jgi:hypothetical protein
VQQPSKQHGKARHHKAAASSSMATVRCKREDELLRVASEGNTGPVAWVARGCSSDTRCWHQRCAGTVRKQWHGWDNAGSACCHAVCGRKTPWWLTCGPSVPFDLIHFSKAPTSKFTNMIFRCPKMMKLFEVINEITRNNFPFGFNFQLLTDFELKILESIQI